MSASQRWSILFVMLAILFVLAGVNASNAAGEDTIVLRYISQKYNAPVNVLNIITRVDSKFPMLGVQLKSFKVLDKRSGNLYVVSFDKQWKEVALDDFEAEQARVYAERYGKMEPALAESLDSYGADENVKVIVFLKDTIGAEKAYARPDIDQKKSKEEFDGLMQQGSDERRKDIEMLAVPIMDRLARMGVAAEYNLDVPVIAASLTPQSIRHVNTWDEVESIYLDGTVEPELEVARVVINGDDVLTRGFNGYGVKIGILEAGQKNSAGTYQGPRYPTGNTYLAAGITQDTTYVCSGANAHSTGVLGIIKSSHSTRKGIAPSASVWLGGSCSGLDSEMQNRTSALKTWGAHVINMSWGTDAGLVPTARDKFFDKFVFDNPSKVLVKSAGNNGGTCGTANGNVTSPGLAYNVLTVGNFDDKNTTSWTDDAMRSCSSWKDPTSTNNDREKPEVAAPGSVINSTTLASPWTGDIGSGTSFSAPMVTGTVALMLDREWTLTASQEVVRAIIMATAMHNIEGNSPKSEYDGVGGIDALRADDVARKVNGSWGLYSYDCSKASTITLSSTPMVLKAGKKARVVIVWNQNPSYAYYATKPSADLDLNIYRGTTFVASSGSFDNTYEIVEFTPSVAATYTIKVYKSRCDLTPKYLGVAWYQNP